MPQKTGEKAENKPPFFVIGVPMPIRAACGVLMNKAQIIRNQTQDSFVLSLIDEIAYYNRKLISEFDTLLTQPDNLIREKLKLLKDSLLNYKHPGEYFMLPDFDIQKLDAINKFLMSPDAGTRLKVELAFQDSTIGFCLHCHTSFDFQSPTRQIEVKKNVLMARELFCSLNCHNSFVAHNRR